MISYESKILDSFHTKLQIFLFYKAFEGSVGTYLKNNNIDIIEKQFENFKLTDSIASVYSSQYYQKTSGEFVSLPKEFGGKNLKVEDIERNLTIENRYMISKSNMKDLLGTIYDELYKMYHGNPPIDEEDFKKLISSEKCFYCGISKKDINELGDKGMLNNKRSDTRGYSLELDRKSPNLEYTLDNCCMSCYWCNNAKTDEFFPNEFKEIARGINAVWNMRMKKINASHESIIFPENNYK